MYFNRIGGVEQSCISKMYPLFVCLNRGIERVEGV
jgi:hypothetical protein